MDVCVLEMKMKGALIQAWDQARMAMAIPAPARMAVDETTSE